MIYLPDIEPGLTIRLLSRFAKRIALSVKDSEIFFPNRDTVVTGYPLRQKVLKATRQKALTHFQLDPHRKTLLIFGGSRGSRAINYAFLNILADILHEGIQVIHVTGTLDWPDIEKRRQVMPNVTHYHAFPYLHHEMGLAMAAADLAVCRAGASVLGEFPFFGLPSILIPLTYVWRYQQVNADYLATRGAAICLDENQMDEELLPTICDLLNNPDRLAQMQTCSRALARSDSAERAAEQLAHLAGVKA
jgi:UDP-N-acetylglucosamine--N-acetylmuramyl-(pentapeptide) pyrophosphoryl-undecaprenol N-acetylglucosamine transferase